MTVDQFLDRYGTARFDARERRTTPMTTSISETEIDHSGPIGITTAEDVLLEDRMQERRQCGKVSADLAKALPGVHIAVYAVCGMAEEVAAGSVEVHGYRVEIGGATLSGDTLEQARNVAFAEVTKIRDHATERKLELRRAEWTRDNVGESHDGLS